MCGSDADDLHRQRQDSALEDALLDHVGIATEDEMVNSRLRFKALMNHDDGSVVAMSRPRDVTENTVRVVCDRWKT